MPAEPDPLDREARVVVDRVQDAPRPVLVDEPPGPLGADVLDPPQVADQHLGIIGRQRARLERLDLRSVAAVIDPDPGHVRALALLKVDQRTHEHDRRAVGAGGVQHGPAGGVV